MKDFYTKLDTLHSSQYDEYIRDFIAEHTPDSNEINSILDYAEKEISTFDDIDKSDVSDFIRQGLISSDFNWKPKQFDISNYSLTNDFISKDDSNELRKKLIFSLDKRTRIEWLSEWFILNQLRIDPLKDQSLIISILEQSLPYPWSTPSKSNENPYYYNIMNLAHTILEPRQGPCTLSLDEKTTLRALMLTFITKALLLELPVGHDYTSVHNKHAADLYGHNSKQIINTAVALGVTNDINYWTSHLIKIEESLDVSTLNF